MVSSQWAQSSRGSVLPGAPSPSALQVPESMPLAALRLLYVGDSGRSALDFSRTLPLT